MRLVESILEAEYRRAAKEKKLLGRSGLKVVKQLAEIEEEHLAGSLLPCPAVFWPH